MIARQQESDEPPRHFFRQWRKFRKMSQTKAALAMGYQSHSPLSKVESGEVKWNESHLAAMVKVYRCTREQLLSENPLASGYEDQTSDEAQPPTTKRATTPVPEYALPMLSDREAEDHYALPPKRYVRLDTEWLMDLVGPRLDNLFLVKMPDGSMSPILHLGDSLLVDRLSADTEEPGIFVVQVAETVSVRSVRIGAAPNTLTISVPGEGTSHFDASFNSVRVIGKVICALKRV